MYFFNEIDLTSSPSSNSSFSFNISSTSSWYFTAVANLYSTALLAFAINIPSAIKFR